MKKMGLTIVSVSCLMMLLAGCGVPHTVSPNGVDGSQTAVYPSTEPVTFFQELRTSGAKLTLAPDATVEQRLPDVPPPDKTVIVYLPVYPESDSTKPVTTIGDMGTPMDGDLLDGTLYYQSKDSLAQIKSWYVQQLQKLGYAMMGQGSATYHGKTTTTYFGFAKVGTLGNPTEFPDINLGFLSGSQGGETVFKLKAYFIVTPPRPKDTYLPSDIVKVVLTKGKSTKTVRDRDWIANVVRMVNRLQVATPGISSGGPNVSGPTTIQADFYAADNTVVHTTYSLLTSNLKVGNGNVPLHAGASPTLIHDLNSVFGN